jgi:hypothetical protein
LNIRANAKRIGSGLNRTKSGNALRKCIVASSRKREKLVNF